MSDIKFVRLSGELWYFKDSEMDRHMIMKLYRASEADTIAFTLLGGELFNNYSLSVKVLLDGKTWFLSEDCNVLRRIHAV